MLPSKFGSVRQKQPTERRTSLRLDASIVALRYEKTAPAEPPIMIVSRDPSRLSRRPSSSSASSHSSRHRPIVIVPPGIVAPPPEDHPAFRGSASTSASSSSSPSPRTSPVSVEEWKRDSGVARNKSTSTIHEEEGEDDYAEVACRSRIPAVESNVSSLISSVMSQPSTTAQQIEDPFVDENSIFEPLTSTSSEALYLLYNAQCTTPSKASSANTTAAAPTSPITTSPTSTPATPTRPSRGSIAPISLAFAEYLPMSMPSSPTGPAPAPVPQSPCRSIPSSPRCSTSSSTAPTLSKSPSSRSRSGSRFGTFSQMFTTPIQPLWRGPTSTNTSTNAGESSNSNIGSAFSSTSSTPTASAQSTMAAPGATASATVSAPATDAALATGLAKSELEQSHPSENDQGSSHFWNRSRSASTTSNNNTSNATSADTSSNNDLPLPFVPLDVSIPCESLIDDAFMSSVSFSNRGSIMFAPQDAAAIDGAIKQQQHNNMASIDSSSSTSTSSSANVDTLATANNDESNSDRATPTPTPSTTVPHDLTPTPTTPTTPRSQSQTFPRPSDESNDMNNSLQGADDASGSLQDPTSAPDIRVLAADVEKESQKVRSLYTVGDGSRGEPGRRHSYHERLEPTPEVPSEENELDPVPNRLSPAWQMPASGSSSSLRSRGGLQDWDDLQGAHVDRYGFITMPPRPHSRMGTPSETRSASGSPRKRNILQKRDPYGLASTLSGSGRRTPTRKVSARSLNTQHSELSVSTSLRSSRSVIRQASNLLPHNRDRRWMDEAGDMLDVAPSLQDIVDEIQAERLTEVMKRKEWERSEKWRKMAKVIRRGGEGEGMGFEFDSKNPKLIERTWKGIPDRWRAAAWWSFMATGAKEHGGMPPEDKIVMEFHRLQLRSSPDDVQIDLDVPRTISRHIMFRRRYRGGQRLLFRVLHAISIYYPDTGYVQGMASLAATLLCYFDEEKSFVMLVRMWQLRGLARLYRPGFEELMAAMDDFSKNWLNKEVASKLDELCIDTTAYGTRWYLTLFNLSVPFPAQLRIWDVFLLLGDGSVAMRPDSRKSESKPTSSGEYDVLHATSAALAQALREVLLGAEFENAMKALTSAIPIKDEDLLMKVVKAEYKQHHGKKKN
ncbi:uncharacterized protein B0J16DRAFT_52899 [Fusarium flagelliforme]|uniref:Rab-GAP TBC domain-containing protein n=1 Tax=Fusarium flagelliforme TaxID=2675880 RepID=A0A395MU87_9HYPO|nr:uncharacterized protein B0J16DRAFT_52899 [Fusarium flagelliforme]KAH7192034.1 hypothetical protein B0J16DRAFT_52899 [Fusarium flagelliforme]RFN51514.1 hypothetical protein FIE12Z_4250 [Fusarium flagelliforme]